MNDRKIKCLRDADITTSVNELTEAFSKFKSSMFKRVMLNQEPDYRDCDKLTATVNKFLKFWDDYSQDITQELSNCKGDPSSNVYAIDYDVVRDYIYAKYDYASILQFTDGVFKGIADEKFKKADDLQDFFDHTVSKAFDDIDPSVGGILDGVLSLDMDETSNLAMSSFRTVKNNKKLFNSRSRVELYKAVTKSIEYLDDNILDLKKTGSYNDTRLFIGAINRIVEYAEISCVIFAARIYIIARYVSPFITSCDNLHVGKVDGESVITEAAASYGDGRYHIFRDINDSILRGPVENGKLIDMFITFIKDMNCDYSTIAQRPSELPRSSGPYISKNIVESNPFCNLMRDNPIYKYLSMASDESKFSSYNLRERGRIDELVEILRDCMYDHQQALQGVGSPRQSLLHIIRGVDVKKETEEEYKKLAVDLYIAAVTILCGISMITNAVSEMQTGELNEPSTSLPAANVGAECLRILSYMYREMAAAIIQKARYIEIKMNELADKTDEKFFQATSISIPGEEKPKQTLNDIMMVAVPDTTRMPLELLDLYSIPTFESLQMFDEFLKIDPMFANDVYFSEAVNLSSIINAILALLQGARKRFQAFWGNQGVQSAVKWVTEHEQELLQMKFQGESMQVLPFKTGTDGKEKIDLKEVSDKLTTGLNAFSNINGDMTNEKSKEFIKNLYPNESVYKFFTDQEDKDGKIGAARYRNYILFAKDIASVTDKDPQLITVADDALQKKLVEWVTTVKSAKVAYDAIMHISDDLEKSVNAMKTKVLGMTSNNQNTATQSASTTGGSDGKPPEVTDKKDGKTEPSTTEPSTTEPSTTAPANEQKNNAAENQNQIISTTLADTQKAIARLWDNATRLFVYYIKTEYGYIKEAYGIGNKQ